MGHLPFQLGAVVTVMAAPLLNFVQPGDFRKGGLALVVSGFNTEPSEVIRIAGLAEVGPERAPFGAYAQIENPYDIVRLKQAGALFVLDGKKVMDLCK